MRRFTISNLTMLTNESGSNFTALKGRKCNIWICSISKRATSIKCAVSERVNQIHWGCLDVWREQETESPHRKCMGVRLKDLVWETDHWSSGRAGWKNSWKRGVSRRGGLDQVTRRCWNWKNWTLPFREVTKHQNYRKIDRKTEKQATMCGKIWTLILLLHCKNFNIGCLRHARNCLISNSSV